MALTARSLQTAIVKALADSLSILGYCDEYFGMPHMINSGGSGRQGANDCPTFAVVAWSRSAGEDDAERSVEMSILLSITDDSIVSDTTTEGVVIDTYGGPEKLEILLELAASEVLGISSEIMITDLNYSFEPLEFYPLFIGGLDFTVTVPVLIGGYEPTIS